MRVCICVYPTSALWRLSETLFFVTPSLRVERTTFSLVCRNKDIKYPKKKKTKKSPIKRTQLTNAIGFLQVYVCGSMANLYMHNSSTAEGGWDLKFTGIPVVLYDSGETRSRNQRRIQILLVERGTAFALWRDTIDNLTSYKVSSQGFHTMCLSTDHTQLVGLSFDCAEAAQGMWAHIDRLTSDPENIRLSGPGGRSKSSRKQKPASARPLPDKKHISQPCCFMHVTNVELADKPRYQSLQNLVPTAAAARD